jgi:hypothetical protein
MAIKKATVKEPIASLHTILRKLNNVFIILDALDECPRGGGRDQTLAIMTNALKLAIYEFCYKPP